MIKKIFLLVFLICFLTLFSTGCPFVSGRHNAWKPAAPREGHFEHIVKWPTETLRIIAKWYTNDEENWSFLVDANPQIDQNNLIKGTIIYLPANLLRNKKALPESFVSAYNQKTKPPRPSSKTKKPSEMVDSKPKPKKEEKKQDDFELFGPK